MLKTEYFIKFSTGSPNHTEREKELCPGNTNADRLISITLRYGLHLEQDSRLVERISPATVFAAPALGRGDYENADIVHACAYVYCGTIIHMRDFRKSTGVGGRVSTDSAI
jgi:hypothetical protein